MKKFLNRILDFFIPPVCPVCLERVDVVHTLCHKCFKNMKFITHPYCEICGRPFEFDLEDERICAKCMKEHPHFSHARSMLVYNNESKELILPFKHADRLELSTLFSKLLSQNYTDFITSNDIIIPVPLHRFRLLYRKYNQAALIAKPLAKQFKKIYLPDTLKRIKATKSQGHKTAEERKKNVNKAFILHHPDRILNKKILLIDDVLTTGATVNECAKVLMQNGASQVNVLTICRVCD